MAEPKKKIIIKKKKIIKKKAPSAKSTGDNAGLPDDVPAPKLKKAASKKISVAKKKSPTAKKEAPPPEVIATSEIEPAPMEERQKTMISDPPIGAARHDDPKEKKEVFKFYCIRCGQKLEAYYDWVGRSINCPRCKATITIPEPLQ